MNACTNMIHRSAAIGAGTYKQIGMNLWWCGWDVLVQRKVPLFSHFKLLWRGSPWSAEAGSCWMATHSACHGSSMACQAQLSMCALLPGGYIQACSRAQNHLTTSLHNLVFSNASMFSFSLRWARHDMCMATDACHQWSTSAVMELDLPDVI